MITAIITSYRMSRNAKLTQPNIVYDYEKDSFIICDIDGHIHIIPRKNYIDVKDNMMTDNLLYFYCIVGGRRIRYNLGYCANRDQIRINIRLIDKK